MHSYRNPNLQDAPGVDVVEKNKNKNPGVQSH